MSNAIMIAFTGINDPEHEGEFNEWYDTVHAPGTLQVPGVVSCRRYKLSTTQMMPSDLPEFLAVYEIDPAALATLPKELGEKAAAGVITSHELMKLGMVAMYEPLSEPQA